MSIKIKSLEFTPDNPLALQSAALFVTEFGLVEEDETVHDRAVRYIDAMDSAELSHYAVTDDEHVVAAAIAAHELAVNAIPQTELVAIAVEKQLQRRGFGRLLIHHVAQQAQLRGDPIISVWPIDRAIREAYKSYGFSGEGVIMHASPTEVLES
jgi:GNAT superfamily N-acetyltransferase